MGRENWIDIFLCLLLEFLWMVEFIMIWYFRFPNVSGLRGNMEGGSVVSPREAVSKRFLTVSRDEFLTAKSLHMWEKKTYVSFLPHEAAGSPLSSSMRVRWALKHLPIFPVLFDYSSCHIIWGEFFRSFHSIQYPVNNDECECFLLRFTNGTQRHKSRGGIHKV